MTQPREPNELKTQAEELGGGGRGVFWRQVREPMESEQGSAFALSKTRKQHRGLGSAVVYDLNNCSSEGPLNEMGPDRRPLQEPECFMSVDSNSLHTSP